MQLLQKANVIKRQGLRLVKGGLCKGCSAQMDQHALLLYVRDWFVQECQG
jgi:hypothetical protein